MDESRKAFERFLREEHLYTDEELDWEDDRNCYAIYPVHIAWKSWQASREEIEIELPLGATKNDYRLRHETSYEGSFNLCLYWVHKAIRDAGIKVKE
ncbi:hypothetical protein SJ598_13660 [Enterobacter bugandensis]|uniref:hypothetical protein n=1 Tax=Enterobacter bugandensis TaxID=881260 RepID=UPI0029DA995A|nr:hypothetical protein [Enterobacter bugandensis]MDX7621231.1 hypothetical protein [Enterobacter bugandensis]